MKANSTTRQLVRTANVTVGNNTQNMQYVDMRGWNSLTAYLNTNTVTAAGGGVTFKLQHSDLTTNVSFVDVPAGQFTGAIAPVDDDADDDKLMPGAIDYLGNKRYARLVAVGSASANGIMFGIYALDANASVTAPVAPIGAAATAT